jgi:hypothetical protein
VPNKLFDKCLRHNLRLDFDMDDCPLCMKERWISNIKREAYEYGFHDGYRKAMYGIKFSTAPKKRPVSKSKKVKTNKIVELDTEGK